MTQFGKCDVCRLRKVKCDETRPQCRACMKKGRDCTYSFGQSARFVSEGISCTGERTKQGKEILLGSRHERPTFKLISGKPHSDSSCTSGLRLKNRQELSSGAGVYQVFAISHPTKQTKTKLATRGGSLSSTQEYVCLKPSRPPSCDDSRLAARWIAMIGSKTRDQDPLHVFGSWIDLVPSRVGRCHAIDMAAVSFIDGQTAFLHPDEKYRVSAQASIAIALRDLRLSLVSSSHPPDDSDVSLAGIMLSCVEVFMGVGNLNYIPHIHGITSLLTRNGPSSLTDEVMRSVFYSNITFEFAESVLDGHDTSFDDPLWLDYSFDHLSSTTTPCDRAFTSVARQFIRMPRLLRLVRQLLENQADEGAKAEALELAETLYFEDLQVDSTITAIMKTALLIVPTTSPDIVPLSTQSFVFGSVQYFTCFILHLAARIFLFGLLQSLNTKFTTSPPFDAEFIVGEEIKAAECVLMSVEWAQGVDPQLPLVALRILLPLQISFGVWHRLEKRAAISNRDEWHRARETKAWIMSKYEEIRRKWGCRPGNDVAMMECKTEAFMGGPLPKWMGGRKPRES